MATICESSKGLFPAPKEMMFFCTCPDWADMCKHVAAVLYGVGNRLDQQPELLFTLRHVDAKDLVLEAGSVLPKGAQAPAVSIMDDADLADVFGLDMALDAALLAPAVRKAAPAKNKKAAVTSKLVKTPKATILAQPVIAAKSKSKSKGVTKGVSKVTEKAKTKVKTITKAHRTDTQGA